MGDKKTNRLQKKKKPEGAGREGEGASVEAAKMW